MQASRQTASRENAGEVPHHIRQEMLGSGTTRQLLPSALDQSKVSPGGRLLKTVSALPILQAGRRVFGKTKPPQKTNARQTVSAVRMRDDGLSSRLR
jgi:hypothetical protein